MKKIKLTQNKYALVDDEDFERVNQYKWHCSACGYAMCRKGKHLIYMHHSILDIPKGMFVDHINRNGLDNRKSNLRIVTHSQNMINRKFQKNNKSGVTGIRWNKKDKRWIAQIRFDCKLLYLGSYTNKKDAIKVRRDAEKKYHGEYKRAN